MALPASLLDQFKGTPVGTLQQRYNAAKTAQEPLKRQWLLNLAFYLGQQWTVYDRSTGMVREAYVRLPRLKYVSNLVQPRVWLQYAAITSQGMPDFRVVSRSSSDTAVARAKSSYAMLQYFREEANWDAAFADALAWALLTGTGFVKVIFDPDAGDALEVGGHTYRTGLVLIDSCSPFEIFADPFARSLDEASWIIHERVRPVEYVQRKYGVKPPTDENIVTLAYGEPRVQLIKRGTPEMPSCLVREYWERPTEEKPEGEYAVWVGNKVLYQGPNRYAEAGVPHPFASCTYLRVPGRVWGETPVSQLRPINVIYNMIRSDILENLTKVSNPMLMAPVSALIKPPEFQPGEVIEFNPLAPQGLTPLQVPPFPPHAMNMLLRLQQEADEVLGVSEITRGIVPRGVRSERAMARLLEQEERRFSVLAGSYEKMVAKALTYALRLAREFIDLPLVLRVTGGDNPEEAALFKAKDIPADVTVVVERGSSLPRSGAAVLDLAFALWDRGIIRDPALLLRLANYGALSEAARDVELDRAQAQRENQRMREGKEAVAEDWHNHVVHLYEHNSFRKTAEYEELGEEVRRLFRDHVEQHMQYVGQQLAEEGGARVAQGRGRRKVSA